MLLLDAGALYAQADRRDPHHSQVVELLKNESGPLVTSQIVAAEADYLILNHLGVEVELAFLEDLAAGTFVADCLSVAELSAALEVGRRYHDLDVGLADASLVVLAHRHETRRLATFNERDFRAMEPLQGGTFVLLPADA